MNPYERLQRVRQYAEWLQQARELTKPKKSKLFLSKDEDHNRQRQFYPLKPKDRD